MNRDEKRKFWRTEKRPDGSIRWRTFDPYSAEDATKKFRPEERARAFAQSEVSEKSGAELTAQEAEMLGEIRDYVLQLRQFFHRTAGYIKDEINEIAESPDLDTRIEKLRESFRAQARATEVDFRHAQEANIRDHWKVKKELNSFRQEHKLENRVAEYPESKLLHLAIVFVALAGEGVANASFFPQDFGLLGGFTTAVLVSVANVGVSLLAGRYFLTQLSHIKVSRRILGMAASAATLLVLAFLHLTVAHYREAVVRNPDAEILSVLAPLWQHPFALEDMQSVLLILIGSVISAIAIIDGYRLDDRYPGYGSVYRRWKQLDDQLLEEKRGFKQKLNGVLEQNIQQLLRIPSELREQERALEALDGDIGAHFSCCESYYEQCNVAAFRLVNSFRKVVQQIFEDPARFPTSEELTAEAIGVLDPREEESEVRRLLKQRLRAIREALGEYERRKEDFRTELEKEYERLTSEEIINQFFSRRVTELQQE